MKKRIKENKLEVTFNLLGLRIDPIIIRMRKMIEKHGKEPLVKAVQSCRHHKPVLAFLLEVADKSSEDNCKISYSELRRKIVDILNSSAFSGKEISHPNIMEELRNIGVEVNPSYISRILRTEINGIIFLRKTKKGRGGTFNVYAKNKKMVSVQGD